MKKALFLLTFVFGALIVLADTPDQSLPEEVNLTVSYVDPTTDIGEPFPRSPVMIPRVAIADHDLYFITPCTGCTLCVVNNQSNVCYSCTISDTCEFLTLPSSLQGTFELQIILGNLCFSGTINL